MPTGLYNSMVLPLTPFQIAGVIWYQGESNAGRPAEYTKLFPLMVEDWRKAWGIGDFSFYWVQIAPYEHGNSKGAHSAYLRESQTHSLKTIKNSGMAVTMDIGVEKDVHPRNKQDVGKRLALWALAKNYGQKDIAYSGPMYKSMRVEGQKIRLYFDNVYGGLLATDGQLSDFIIAGEDQKFVPAKRSSTAIRSSSQVPRCKNPLLPDTAGPTGSWAHCLIKKACRPVPSAPTTGTTTPTARSRFRFISIDCCL